MKVTIVHKRDYSVTNDKNGKSYAGFIYGGFQENGTPIKFSSAVSTHPVVVATGYDPNNCVDVNLGTKFDETSGKIKFQEIQS